MDHAHVRMAELIDAFPAPCLVADVQARVRLVNRAFLALTGFARADLLGEVVYLHTTPERFHASYAERWRSAHSELLTEGIADPREFVLRTKAGDELPVSLTVRPLEIDGEPALLGVFHDESEAHLTQARLAASEQSYRQLVESAKDAIFTIDMEGNFLSANAATARSSGYSRDELLRMNVAALLPPDAVAGPAQSVDQNGRTPVELVYRRRDGSISWVEARTNLIHDAEGRAVAMQIIARDVSERKRTEEALRASEERYRSLLENTSDIVVEVDHLARYTYVSANLEEALGYRPEEVLGHSPLDRIHPDDRDAVADAVTRGVGGGTSTYRYKHKDGAWRWFEARAKTYRAADGEPRAVIVARDVTEQRALEARVQQAQRMESIGNLAGGIAHDFNNLMTVVSANLEMAAQEAPPNVRQLIETAVDAVGDASELSRQLLAIGRATAGVRRPLCLADVIRDVTAMLARALPEHVVLDTSAPDDLRVIGNAGQLKQVLLNLAVNASDAMPNGGRITMRARRADVLPDAAPLRPRDDGYVLVEVCDEGVGMDEETAARMFDPFFTTKGEAGTGLGSSIVYGLVREHGGIVTAASTPSVGTTMQVYLPAADPVPVQSPPNGKRATARRALVVDDKDSLRLVMQRILDRAGFETSCAGGAREAIHVVERAAQPFDLAVIDCAMPDMPGRAVYDHLRRTSPRTRTLFVSGYARDALDGLRPAVAWGFLAKPFGAEELVTAVQRLLTANSAEEWEGRPASDAPRR